MIKFGFSQTIASDEGRTEEKGNVLGQLPTDDRTLLLRVLNTSLDTNLLVKEVLDCLKKNPSASHSYEDPPEPATTDEELESLAMLPNIVRGFKIVITKLL